MSPTATEDVIEALKKPIEGKRIDVIYDKDTHSLRGKFRKYLETVKPRL